MKVFEIDQAIGKLIALQLENGGLSPQEEATFRSLCTLRTNAMRRPRKRIQR